MDREIVIAVLKTLPRYEIEAGYEGGLLIGVDSEGEWVHWKDIEALCESA
jgi:hypothetical protein